VAQSSDGVLIARVFEDEDSRERSKPAVRCSVGRSTLEAVLPAISSAAAGSLQQALQATLASEPLPQRVGQRAHRHKECKRIA